MAKKNKKERKSPYTLYLLMDDADGNQLPSNKAVEKGKFPGLKEIQNWIESDAGDGIWRFEDTYGALANILRERSEKTVWREKPAIDIPCVAVGETINQEGTTGIYWLLREPEAA